MPLQSTSGAASYDAFGGGAAAKVNYIEDFFQSYLRTGTGASATVTTGLNGSTKETLVWTKSRSAATNHKLTDNVRGATKALSSNTTGAEATDSQGLTAFSATGYTIGTNTDYNNSGATYVDWQWVAQPKFFDVVTYTGNGATSRNVSHNLGSDPGCIIVKRTSGAGSDWSVYHRSTGTGKRLILNQTLAVLTDADMFASVTSTTFSVSGNTDQNDNGATYVAYLFAHNAGGFGLTGTDNVISCGSFTGSASGTTVNLGWEPQWVLIKRSSGNTDNWRIYDNMRGMTASNGGQLLYADTSGSETTNSRISVNATGFGFVDDAAYGNIYIAIRRGPMKVPTSGASVFSPNISSGSVGTVITTNFPVDMQINAVRDITFDKNVVDRLRGVITTPTDTLATRLRTNLTNGEGDNFYSRGWNNTGFQMPTTIADASDVFWSFRRAPSFFDEVCYTGTGSNTTFTHNLGVAPELMIFKRRDTTANWRVYSSSQPASDLGTLNSNIYFQTDSNVLNSTAPTSSVFTVGTNAQTNASGGTYVAYLFATTAGVSKVGSYTGTGTTLQINCGFTGGSRFVLIKRVDDSADWYVWDSARGIVSGNDPYLLLNSTAAEVTNTDYVDTYSAGFEISSTAPAAINANGGTFIFLAIA